MDSLGVLLLLAQDVTHPSSLGAGPMQRAEKLVAPNAPVNWMRWKRLEQNRLSGVLLDAIPSRQWPLLGLVTQFSAL